MGAPVKTQVEDGLIQLSNFRDQIIDVSDQAVFILKDLGPHDEEVKKTNVRNILTVGQGQSGYFLSLILTVCPDQDNPNWKHSCMTCRACIQLPLNLDGTDASIYNQIPKTPHDL